MLWPKGFYSSLQLRITRVHVKTFICCSQRKGAETSPCVRGSRAVIATGIQIYPSSVGRRDIRKLIEMIVSCRYDDVTSATAAVWLALA